MKWTLKLGRFAGIDVYLHTTFFLLIGWIGLILIILGILYNGTFKSGFADGRIAIVLAQIGIG